MSGLELAAQGRVDAVDRTKCQSRDREHGERSGPACRKLFWWSDAIRISDSGLAISD